MKGWSMSSRLPSSSVLDANSDVFQGSADDSNEWITVGGVSGELESTSPLYRTQAASGLN
jgi:hypothetical protein